MTKKTFPKQETVRFDTEKNTMMLVSDGVETPCVNWHQYSQIMVPEKKMETLDGGYTQCGRTQKGQIEASFVAILVSGQEDVDIVIIGHSIVHPSDAHKAFKAHGRTVAGLRLVKAVKTPEYAYAELATLEEPNTKPVLFLLLDDAVRAKMKLYNPEFLPSIYRRLKKLDS